MGFLDFADRYITPKKASTASVQSCALSRTESASPSILFMSM